MKLSPKNTTKVLLAIFILIIVGTAAYFELAFRQIQEISGVIHGCFYADADFGCSYVVSQKGNFLLTQASVDKMRQSQDAQIIYDRQVRLFGRISRQQLGVRNLGLMNRFQVERWQFE